jgi:very-short-patch-repair endonuclease
MSSPPSQGGVGVGASASELCYADAMRRVDPKLTRHARDLHNASTMAERMLWLRLRQYRPRFTRQLVIGPYIVDLACREARVAVELDGGQHAERTVDYDRRRSAFLEDQGWLVVRLWNNEVVGNPDGAAELVLLSCAERLGSTHPQPLPSREGRVRRPRSRPVPPFPPTEG